MELFVLQISKNWLPFVTDNKESKTEPKASYIFDTEKFPVGNAIQYMHGWFLVFCPINAGESLQVYLMNFPLSAVTPRYKGFEEYRSDSVYLTIRGKSSLL